MNSNIVKFCGEIQFSETVLLFVKSVFMQEVPRPLIHVVIWSLSVRSSSLHRVPVKLCLGEKGRPM